MQTVADIIARLDSPKGVPQLEAPHYSLHRPRGSIGLAVESMKRHMTSEGWDIFAGLQEAGYQLAGFNLLPIDKTDIREIITKYDPSTVLLQDIREWDVKPGDFREPRARFTNVESLKDRHDIFKLTILKDSHQRPIYHSESAAEIGCHGWVIYYHPQIVHHLAPYTRPEHLVRTYHSINLSHLPSISFRKEERSQCLLSGAMGKAYPLRTRLASNLRMMNGNGININYINHPGYHLNGCATPAYLKTLSGFRVAICTSSIYGYALRKIIEATACGCVVLTDLPSDEVLPHIDGNLCRIHPNISSREVGLLCKKLANTWCSEVQRRYAELAQIYYSHISVGKRLADDIENLRLNYSKKRDGNERK